MHALGRATGRSERTCQPHPAQELVLWPITKGWERAEHQRLLLGTPRSGTSAMVLNYCTSADRFGQAHDLAWLLEPPFGDPTQAP